MTQAQFYLPLPPATLEKAEQTVEGLAAILSTCTLYTTDGWGLILADGNLTPEVLEKVVVNAFAKVMIKATPFQTKNLHQYEVMIVKGTPDQDGALQTLLEGLFAAPDDWTLLELDSSEKQQAWLLCTFLNVPSLFDPIQDRLNQLGMTAARPTHHQRGGRSA